LVTVVGLSFGGLLGGSVITETVFSWPGVGFLAVQAVNNRDFALVQASVIVLAICVVLCNLLVDLVYPIIDPRISAQAA
jgi:ABC-type dipeptide/oligopeptide/nickel transport system permease component